MDKACKKVLEDFHLMVQKIAAEVGISTGSVHSIFIEDLNLWRVSTKFALKLRIEQQKGLGKKISIGVLDLANSNSKFIKTINTGDLTWVYSFDQEP